MGNPKRRQSHKHIQKEQPEGPGSISDPYKHVYIPTQYYSSSDEESHNRAETNSKKDELARLRQIIHEQANWIRELQMQVCKGSLTLQGDQNESSTPWTNEAEKHETTPDSEQALEGLSESPKDRSDTDISDSFSTCANANGILGLRRNSEFLKNTVIPYVSLTITNFQTSSNSTFSQTANCLKQKLRKVQELDLRDTSSIVSLSEIMDNLLYLHIQQSAQLNNQLELNKSIHKFEEAYKDHHLGTKEGNPSGGATTGCHQCRTTQINCVVPVELETHTPLEEKPGDEEWHSMINRVAHRMLDNKAPYARHRYIQNSGGLHENRQYRNISGSN